MRCTKPRTVGFKADGKTISWSPRHRNKEFAEFQLPCGKCIACRLDYARQWAVRCVHEAQMHSQNSFITLTYDDDHLLSPFLQYDDFQKFAKRLRRRLSRPIGYFVTGEYGEETKRPHWHVCVFGWSPPDGTYKYSNSRGDKAYESELLTELWGKGLAEYGSVTFHSAGYVARYAAKKLVHGHDDGHAFHPISKKSSKHAIGKAWLERYWPDVFNHGQIVLPDGSTCSVPRYYEKWFREHHPEKYLRYITETKLKKTDFAQIRFDREKKQWLEYRAERRDRTPLAPDPLTKNQVRAVIQQERFKLLQKYLKL